MTQTATDDPTATAATDAPTDPLASAKVSFAAFVTAYAASNQATASIIAAQQEVIAAQNDLSAAQHAKTAADLTVARSFAKVEADLNGLGIAAPAPEDVTPTTPDGSGDTAVVVDGTTGQPVVVATEQSTLPTGTPIPVVTADDGTVSAATDTPAPTADAAAGSTPSAGSGDSTPAASAGTDPNAVTADATPGAAGTGEGAATA